MSLAAVSGLEADAGENPIEGMLVSAQLYPTSIFAYNPDGAAIDTPPQETNTAEDGSWSIALECTDTLVPAGMVYRISRVIFGGTDPVHQLDVFITVPAGGGSLENLLTSQPASPPPGTGPVGPQGGQGPQGVPGTSFGGASVNEFELTGTDPTTVLSFTPTEAAPYTIGFYVRVTESDTEVQVSVEYTDAAGAQAALLLPPANLGPGSYLYPAVVIGSVAESPIEVVASASTASQVYVSAIIR